MKAHLIRIFNQPLWSPAMTPDDFDRFTDLALLVIAFLCLIWLLFGSALRNGE